jgi:hypothetical protein
MLTKPGILIIESGDKKAEYQAPSGIHFWEADLGLGKQMFRLNREGATILEKAGERTVKKSPKYKSWSLFSGFTTHSHSGE